jgi:hypothetical protein
MMAILPVILESDEAFSMAVDGSFRLLICCAIYALIFGFCK